MKVLLTGANGLLGQKLVTLLLTDPDIELIATGRGACRLPVVQNLRFRYESMDISQPAQVNAVFEQVKPEAVIHTAAMTQADACEQQQELCHTVNVKGTEHLLKAAQNHQAYFQFLSTDFVFDGLSGPYSEEDEPNPVNFYGETKLSGEKLVQNSGLPYSIIRTVLVYGLSHDMSRSNIILWVKSSLEAGKSIKVVSDQWRTPTLAEDLAQGCYLALKAKAEGIYHISGDDFLTPYEMAVCTANFFKLDQSLMTEVNASVFSQPAKRPPRTGFVIEKAKKKLDFIPKSFKNGVSLLFEQLKMK